MWLPSEPSCCKIMPKAEQNMIKPKMLGPSFIVVALFRTYVGAESLISSSAARNKIKIVFYLTWQLEEKRKKKIGLKDSKTKLWTNERVSK